MTPQEARERVLKAVPDAYAYFNRISGSWFVREADGNENPECLSDYKDLWDTEDEAWLSAANSDRVKQFYKEA